MKINVFNQASIKLENNVNIYFDTYNFKSEIHDADYIFITHDHYDHYDEESINKIIKDNTTIIVPGYLKEKASKLINRVIVVEPNKTYQVDDIKFETVASYNINKKFHPQENGNVGYILTIDGIKYYVMGDTDRTQETDMVKTDVCFVPIGGTYTMDVNEAIDYINYIKPKKAIPIHYGSIVGDITLGEEFKNKINKEIEVELLIK